MSKRKAYQYATLTAQGIDTVLVHNLHSKREGQVVKIGLGEFKATRHFGENRTMTFKITGNVINEGRALSAAIEWSVIKYDCVSPRNKSGQGGLLTPSQITSS